MTETIEETLTTFFEQAATNNLATGNYPQDYADLKLKVGFGVGKVARIAWIVFLGEDQNPQNGIFPVYYFFKEHNKLVLAYGISETENPKKNWLLGPRTETVSKYFSGLGITPYKYGASYVYEVYDTDKELDWNKVENDLKNLIKYYKLIMQTR